MTAIITLLYGLQACQNHRERQNLANIIVALLCVTGRITGTSLARVLEGQMSRRTLQRWMQGAHDWASLLWGVVKANRLKPDGVYLLAADDVVVPKSGKQTHGRGRFYSSIAQRWMCRHARAIRCRSNNACPRPRLNRRRRVRRLNGGEDARRGARIMPMSLRC